MSISPLEQTTEEEVDSQSIRESVNDLESLFDALLQLKTREEIARFFRDLCTPAEMRELADRWLIARLLDNGKMSYRDISARTGASTTTVGRVARFLKEEPYQGYKLVLKRLNK